jgi:hypothetical protein
MRSVNEVKADLDEQEQYTRRDSLEVRGVPITVDEDIDEIIQSIGKLLDVEIDDSDISVSHRLPSRARGTSTGAKFPPAIIVKFTNRNIRDELYRSRSKLKSFDINDIGLGRYGNEKIYIQESLTAKRKKLFKECLEIRKNARYKFIWTYYGTIYLRKNESSPAVRITSFKELEKLRLSQARNGRAAYP